MKRKLYISLLISFIFIIFGYNNIFATDYYVSNSGNDNDNGSISSPWKIIQKTANSVFAGDNLYNNPSTFYKRIAINISENVNLPIAISDYPGITAVCTNPGPITGQSPTGILTACTNSITFSWNDDPNAVYYRLRIDQDPDSWGGSCSNIDPGDTCIDNLSGNSFARTVIPGKTYKWWVEAVGSCN